MPSLCRLSGPEQKDPSRVHSVPTSAEDNAKRKRTYHEARLNPSSLVEIKRTKEVDDADVRDDRQCIEQTVTDEPVEESKAEIAVEVTREACDNDCASLLPNSSGDARQERTVDNTQATVQTDGDRFDDVSRQDRNVTEEKIDVDEDYVTLEDEPVYPHDLHSINHDILSHFIAVPFHHCAMKSLYSRINLRECEVSLPPWKLPITRQKRYIQLARSRLKEMRSIRSAHTNKHQTNSGVSQVSTKASPSQNTRVDKNSFTSHAMPPQCHLNPPQFQPHRHTTQQNVESNSSTAVPLQQSIWNPTNTAQTHTNLPITNKPNIFHNPYFVQHNMMQMNSHAHRNMSSAASAARVPNAFHQATSFPFQYFPPSRFNTGNAYLHNFQHFQMMRMSQAACNTTTSLPLLAPPVPPQTPASKAITLTESTMQSTAKLPVAFGFKLNTDDNVESLAQSKSTAAQWVQNGMKAMHASQTPSLSTPKARKTPRTSPNLKPNSSPRTSPKLVPTKVPLNDLPEGWTAKTFLRQGGNTAGSTDTYFYSPLNQIKFRSKKAVRIFSDILKDGGVNGDEKKAFELFKQRGHKL